MIGRKLLHYGIIEKLGEGGMGVVYKARDTHLDRFVAVKVLPPEKVADAERKRRFVQEAKAASALNHPNIVHVYDISSDGGVDFIAMEYVGGKTLDQLIPRKGMRLNDALKLAVQVADALTRAHAAGIVHRDLKPGNIMVSEHGLVKVLDFGLAKLTESALGEDEATRTAKPRTEEGTVVGTAAYMSPEQAEGKPVDARSDIFSFGAVLYEMVTGARAFRGDSRMSTLAAVLHHEPAPMGGEIPRELERIIRRCLRKDADKRFHHMVDVRVALEELKEESGSGRLAVSPQTVVEPARKLPRVWILAIAATLLTALSVAWLALRPEGSPAAAVRLAPLTAYAGWAGEPCFSPDGNEVVFSWNGEKQDNFDIYRILIGGGTPLRLTADPRSDYSPAWSPDGRWVAFLREVSDQGSSLILLPALGGPERALSDVAGARSFWAGERYVGWSPDGKWLAVRDGGSLALVSAETGAKRVLTEPLRGQRDFDPSISPDGRSVAFVRQMTLMVNHLQVLRLQEDLSPAGKPVALTRGNLIAGSPVWSPDGTQIQFAWGTSGNVRLWKVPADGTGEPRPASAFAEDIDSPAISHQKSRMIYVRRAIDLNIWGLALSGRGGGTARPVPVLASTQIEFEPRYSPDGKRLTFWSNRTGEPEIWVSGSDGSNARPLTSMKGPNGGCPRWSPDGARIAFDARVAGQSDIHVVQVSGGQVRPLVTHPAEDRVPSWSGDGKWVYFASNRSGRDEIWKLPPGGGEPVQVTRNGGFGPLESSDGKMLFYAKNSNNWKPTSLWRVPVEGGREEQVLEIMANWGTFCPVSDGIYFARNLGPGRGAVVEFLSFASGRIEPVTDLEKPLYLGLAVAPDRSRILFTQIDRQESNLILVENFR
jgi:Tol biopolymer transport system component/predicted Ser/Thr protein kinase